MNADRLIIADAFPATLNAAYHPHLSQLRARRLSGVYAITDRRSHRVLYVGESHTGRLYDTITRHFRRWKIRPGADAQGRRRGGEEYNRADVAVVYLVTPAALAQQVQYAEIQRLKPRDNDVEGCSVTGTCDIPT